jgi:hypothetical protein
MDSSHLSEEMVESYAMGKLAEPEIAHVEEHLLICDRCQEQVAKMDEFIRATRGAANIVHGAPLGPWERFRGFVAFHPGSAWAAASVLAAAVVVFTLAPWGSRAPQFIELSTIRGTELASPHAKANTPIDLQLDVTEMPVSSLYTLELVDSSGKIIQNYTSEPKASKVSVTITERLPAGQYWIRLYGNSLKTELLREYGLKVD